MGRILNGDDWVWPIVLRQRGGTCDPGGVCKISQAKGQETRSAPHMPQARSLTHSLARAHARSPSRSRSRSRSLSFSLALNLSLALPCDLARGCQRLVCMLERDRERESLQGTRTYNTLSRAEDTCGMGTMSCHSGREEYATHGIRSPSLSIGGVTRAGP